MPMLMPLRVAGSLLAVSLLLPGCDPLGGLDPDGGEPEPGDEFMPPQVGFGGTIWGEATAGEGLDPGRVRLGAFRTRRSVSVVLDSGDLDDEVVGVSVSFREASPVLSHTGPEPTGIDRYLLEPDVLATFDDDPARSFELTLPDEGQGEYVVLAWYDDDDDGRLALTPDGPGSEYSTPLQKVDPSVAPDYRMVLELVSWREEDVEHPVWFGSAAGPEGPDGFAHEQSLHRLGPEAWEAEIPAALR